MKNQGIAKVIRLNSPGIMGIIPNRPHSRPDISLNHGYLHQIEQQFIQPLLRYVWSGGPTNEQAYIAIHGATHTPLPSHYTTK